jgi:hypothetical protein
MIGQKKANEKYLREKFSLCEIKVIENGQFKDEIKLTLEERKKNVCD